MVRFVRSASLSVALLALSSLLAGCTKSDPLYCDTSKPCAPGFDCDYPTRTCVSKPDGGQQDGRTAGDLAPMVLDGPKRSNGVACQVAAQCASNFCVEDVCCESACSDTCKSCALSGSEGKCSAVPNGQDPRKQCPAPTCAAGALTTSACNGQGACLNTPKSCGGYACEPNGTACKTSCTATAQCASGNFCTLSTCRKFTPVPTGTTNDLNAIWGASATDIWAGGAGGTILHWDGTAWSNYQSPTTDRIMAMWGSSDGYIWAVADTTTNPCLQYFSGKWSAFGCKHVPLYGVWGSDQNHYVYVVGSGGMIIVLDYRTTQMVSYLTSVTTSTLRAVAGTSATDIWAVGDGGVILRSNGSGVLGWTSFSSGTVQALYSVAPLSTSDVWAAGNSNTVVRFNGTSWSPVPGVPMDVIYGMAAISPTDVWAVGGFYGAAAHWEGSWVPANVGTTTETVAKIQLIGNELWVVGSGGFCARAQ